MADGHPLTSQDVVRAIERTASEHLGRRWLSRGFTDLDEQSSHPAGIHHGEPFSVFAKLTVADGGRHQFDSELRGLDVIRNLTPAQTPTPVASGLAEVAGGSLLLFEAVPERPSASRTPEDFRAIGRALATLHRVHDDRFGLTKVDGYFGPLPMDNQPVPSNRWPDFYAERRVTPLLRLAVDSGNLPPELAQAVHRLVRRLPDLCGPEPRPSLLHGDAQQNNFLSTSTGAVVIDACPYFGHPEVDLALAGYFQEVPEAVFDGYREISPIDAGFAGRRELWRVFGYLAVIAVDGQNPFGRQFTSRLADALALYD